VDTLTLTRPDDWHLHLRDAALLRDVLPHTARQFARAIVMPNLTPPVATCEQASAYRDRILKRLPEGLDFEPLMTLYLTPDTVAEEIERAAASDFVHAVKLYPAGATTNSEAGLASLDGAHSVFEAMQACGLPLLVHGESTDPDCDVFDRERVFLEETLLPLLERFDGLRVVFEHITTREAARFVAEAPERVAATITPHHLLLNRNALFAGGLRPHHYCLPVLKAEAHRQALLEAATSGSPKFFLGTDSAPHLRGSKEQACGCAGIYSAHAALELYAEAFESVGALDRLEGFASFYGPDFYGLPRNRGQVTLRRERWEAPACYKAAGEELVPLRAGESIGWKLAEG
jgi:dihydroorotase